MESNNMDTSNGQSAAGNKSTHRPFGETLTAVNGETIDNERLLYVAQLLAMTVTKPQVSTQIDTPKKPMTISPAGQFRKYTLRQELIPKKPMTISPAEHLREYMLRRAQIKLQDPPVLKSWEASKLCDDSWRDPAYEQAAKAVCITKCEVVRQCLENDRISGGEPGIRAGMDQAERQDIYLRELDLVGIADAIYAARRYESQIK